MYYHDFKNDEFADIYIFKGKKNGYFVEVGACTGICASQCYYFEEKLNWDGIAVEPQKRFQEKLKKNRKNPCFKCLTNKKDMVLFAETVNEYNSALSGLKNTLVNHEKIEPHKTGWRDNGYNEYLVESTTLLDLLEEYNSPNVIDYLGMDCEGCEYDILEHYFNNNNNKYLIKFICLEVGRNDIIDLMKKNDYIEIINPILPLCNGKKVTWERYFIHKTEISNIDTKILMN